MISYWLEQIVRGLRQVLSHPHNGLFGGRRLVPVRVRAVSHRWPLVVCAMAVGLATAAEPVSAQGTAKKTATSEKITVQTKDGVSLHCTYFPSSAGRSAPVAILLHGKGGNRLAWQTGVGQTPGFAQALQMNDFAVITVDLRGHGENIAATSTGKSEATRLTPRDYAAMVALDLDAVKRYVFEQHQRQALNMNKLAIVATDLSTPVALMFTDIDWSKEPYDDAPSLEQRTPRGQDVRALVLISPDTRVPGLNINTAVTRLRNLKMPVLIAVGQKDSLDKGMAKKLAELIMPKAEGTPYVVLEQIDTKFRGADLLNKGTGLEPLMYKFLDENVKKAPGEWRDRKSPLMD